jgi:acyl carrier protein
MTAPTQSRIEAWLLERLRERLGEGSEQVDPHLPFSYYGLDSLDAVALATELEEWLGVPVEPDVAWDHPTAHAVAAYLSGEPDEPVPASEPLSDGSVAALLAELEEDDATG